MRFKQVFNEELGKYEMVPIDEAAARHSRGSAVHGDIQSFVSPVDGSVISDRKQLREHNKRNNVVNADEFTPEFYEQAAKKRSDHYEGRKTTRESQIAKMEIYEHWMAKEREVFRNQ